MKKIFLFILVIAFFFSAKAQQSRIDIGVEVGLSLMGAQIVPKDGNFKATMFEYDAGLTVLYALTDNLSLRTGLFHMNDYGSCSKINYCPERSSLLITYAFYQGKSINIPFAIRGSYGRRFRVFMEVGIVPGYEYESIAGRLGESAMDNANVDFVVDNSTPSTTESSESSSFFRTLLDLRAGFNFHLSKRLMLEAGAGLYMTTRPLDLSADPDFISGKMEVPVHLSLYYKI